MIATSITEPVRFTPKWLAGRADAPVYLLRAGSLIERGQLEAELRGRYQAGLVDPAELMEVASAGAAVLWKGDAALDRILALLTADDDERTDDDRVFMTEVGRLLTAHWPDYAVLSEQSQRRIELVPLLAFQRFCVGWENVAAAFVVGRDGRVSDESMRAIPDPEMKMAGLQAWRLLWGMEQEGNFERPAPSENGPQTSPSDAPAHSPAGGTSEADAG